MTTKTKEENQVDYLYRRYRIELEFYTPIAAGLPLNKGLVSAHIARFSNRVTNDLKLSMKNDGEVSEEAMAKYMASCSSVFPLDENGIYLRGYQINAMLKDAAQRMKVTLKIRGLGNTIRDGGLLFPDKIYLGVEPNIVERGVKPDNAPANIKIYQTADVGRLSFPCAVLENGDLTDELFRQIWVVSQGNGLGANRHLGHGRFEVMSIEETGNWNIAELFRSGHANGSESTSMSPLPTSVQGSARV